MRVPKRSMHVSVIVIGGGPAGTSTAISLQRLGYSVIIVERSKYEDWRVGETLPPYATTLLNYLGASDLFLRQDHIPSYAIHSAWGSAELHENDFIFSPYGSGWHIDRKRFDSMLAGAAEAAGATILSGAEVTVITRHGEGWKVLIESEGTVIRAEALFLVDATGHAGQIARSQGSVRRFYDLMVGVNGILSPDSSRAVTTPVLMLEAVETGWWYSVPLPNGSLLATWMTDADFIPRDRLERLAFWTAQLKRTTHTADRARGFSPRSSLQVRTARTCRLDPINGSGWVAVGDAATVYDPLSAAGITKALQSGLRAADSIKSHLDGNSSALDEYATRTVKDFENYLVQRLKYYGNETRWSDSLFWSRRQVLNAGQRRSYTNPLNGLGPAPIYN